MGIINRRGSTSPRSALTSSASLLTIAAGAASWSGLAQAAGEDTGSQMILLPEHYELMESGVVVFKLETGENLSLTADQYLILEDGLLLITDELAQASIYTLPVMGSVRAQLLTDLEQVAATDGTVAEATPAQTLSITEGQAPRLSEQVELQSYELAQKSECEEGSDDDDEGCALPLGASSEASGSEGLAVGMSVAPGAMALLGMLMTSDQPGKDELAFSSSTTANFAENGTATVYTAVATGADGDTLTYHLVGGADQALFNLDRSSGALTFNSAPDYENPIDASSPPDNVYEVQIEARDGNGASVSQTVSITVTNADDDPSACPPCPAPPPAPSVSEFWTNADVADAALTAITGSNANSFVGYAAASTAAATDPLTDVGRGSTATFDMSAGGNNFFVAGSDAARDGSLTYTGGPISDNLTFGDTFAGRGGSATFDMSAGGDNTLVAGNDAGSSFGVLNYTGGCGVDSLTFGEYFLNFGGSATIDMSAGGNNTFVAGYRPASGTATLHYVGGCGDDSLTFGAGLGRQQATATFDMTAGGDNTFISGRTAALSGTVIYKGGTGADILTFGETAAFQGFLDIRLGDDAAADAITFEGTIGKEANQIGIGEGTVTIQHFNFNDDIVEVVDGISATVGEITDAGGNLTWTDAGGEHKLTFVGIGAGGTGVTATSAQLAAAII